jgi:hypothetical protein
MSVSAQTRFYQYPKVTYFSDTDLVMLSKSDSVITKIFLMKYLRAYENSIKDTTPGTGHTVVLTNGYGALAIHGTAVISAVTVTLPSNPINSQPFTITTDTTITTLTLIGGTVRGHNYSPTYNYTPVRLIWDALHSQWVWR